MRRLYTSTAIKSWRTPNCRLICGSSVTQIRCNTSMFGSQTQAWSYVKQQTLDEASSKVCLIFNSMCWYLVTVKPFYFLCYITVYHIRSSIVSSKISFIRSLKWCLSLPLSSKIKILLWLCWHWFCSQFFCLVAFYSANAFPNAMGWQI